MKINRLVTFGCSFMVGHGIHDTWDAEKKLSINAQFSRSKYAWVETLGQALDLPVANQSIAGSSNKEISFLVKEFDFKEGDLALINWTFKERSCIIGRPGTTLDDRSNFHLSIHDDNEVNRVWQSYHVTAENLHAESIDAIYSAAWYLEKVGVPQRHLFLKDWGWQSETQGVFMKENLNIIPISFDFSVGPRGHDGMHPSLETYTAYAQEVYEWIKENEDINKR